MFTFIKNLFSILYKAPALIGIIKAIIDIVGSDTARALIEAIKDVIQKFKTTDVPVDTMPPQERTRLIERIKIRVAQRFLGWNDSQMETAMNAFRPENSAALMA